jgi:hypothetical protein
MQQARSEVVPNALVPPNLVCLYRREVEQLERLLDDAAHKDEAMNSFAR